jgi:hypothetical protein
MKKEILLLIRHFRIAPIIGFGYWKDTYLKEVHGISGVAHNFILPFIRIQWGYLLKD